MGVEYAMRRLHTSPTVSVLILVVDMTSTPAGPRRKRRFNISRQAATCGILNRFNNINSDHSCRTRLHPSGLRIVYVVLQGEMKFKYSPPAKSRECSRVYLQNESTSKDKHDRAATSNNNITSIQHWAPTPDGLDETDGR